MLRRRRGSGEGGGAVSLGANTGALLASRLVQAVLGWVCAVLIARSLSLEDFGEFTLVFTVLGMMSIVTDLGIGRLAVRGMVGDDPVAFAGSYLVLRTLLGLVGYAVALLVVVLSGYPSELVWATAVAGIVVVLATPSSALNVVFQARHRVGVIGLMDTVGMLAQAALTAAIAAGGGTLLLFTIPAVLYQVVVLAWKLPAAHRLVPVRPRIDVPQWRAMLREAVPLSIGFGLATVYVKVDGVLLSHLAGFEAVGVYGVSYKFIDIVHFVSTAVTLPLVPLLVTTWSVDMPAFRDALRRGALLLGLLGGLALTGLLPFIGQATGLLYGEEFTPGADTTRLLAVAEMLAFATALAVSCLISAGRNRVYPVVMLVGLALNIALNLALIPRWSYLGSGIATLVTNALVLAALWWLMLRLPGVRPLGLGRLLAVPVALAAGVGTGLALDRVAPWPLAGAAGALVYLAIAHVTRLVRDSGLRARDTAPATSGGAA